MQYGGDAQADLVWTLGWYETAARAGWWVELLQEHPAFREGVVFTEMGDPPGNLLGRFRLAYRGPRVHRDFSLYMEPMDAFSTHEQAERECARLNREIPADEPSLVHVEEDDGGGSWCLWWLAAAVQHLGDWKPALPDRPA